ncbi:hypothetical protein EYB25_010002 [Talaromyces marneffei]|uniref:uncharacterized protein n=1 Tax=Talaromyces marneffei TaxID=37727 RepID=UPI0012A9779D|nr:uncharacterized protein EYB26_009266 [Talaromyces marneffei]KAE8548208.1 hypothetical protein EYB25_010002 [Talaromyces marneffei]QGA21555.1 hypothetical protein EYB26_009266 [Talaromyces marneffei]
MPKPHQIHPSTHLQDILSARRVRAKTISSSIAPSAPSTPTKEVREETPPEHMPVLRSRRHMRRSAGRPRLEAAGEAILSEYRRDQIRRAQRTYRLKKEATLEKAKEHAANLEDRLNRTAAAIDEYKASIPPDLRNSHPALLGHLDCMADLTNLDCEPVTQLAPQGSNRYSFTSEKHILPSQQNAMSNGQLAAGTSGLDCDCLDGYRIKKSTELLATHSRERAQNSSLIDDSERESTSPVRIYDITQMQDKNAPYTYSFQETEFHRRLQRYCLEYAFRLFSDSCSNPLDVYRVFRLVPCIQDRTKMYPLFRKLVTSGIKDALEISNLPFYSIGGAGTHYPKMDVLGNPVYPANSRTPKRILGLFGKPGAMKEHDQENDYQKLLEVYGYAGEWFDCRDVEGYLREQGVDLEDSASFPPVQCHQACQEIQVSEAHGEYSLNAPCDDIVTLPEPSKSCIIDIEQFLSRLLHGVVILGRAPAFRRTDVTNAFKSALRVQIRWLDNEFLHSMV